MVSQKGFSMVELLVAIAIIAALAAITVPIYTEQKVLHLPNQSGSLVDNLHR